MTDSRKRTRGHTRRRALLAVPVAAAAVLALTACDPREAGSAAVVGGTTRITESQVDADAQAVVDQITHDGGAVPATDKLLKAQVEFRVDARLVDIAAQRKHITITQGQIDNLITASGGRETLIKQFSAADGLWMPPDQLDTLAREFLIQQALGINLAPGKTADEQAAAATEYVTALSQQVGVTVSPRYGVFDFSTLRMGGLANDLSVPADSASASPSPSESPSAIG